VNRRLDRDECQVIHHFDRGGNDAGRDDSRDRFARVRDPIEERQHRLDGLGDRSKLDDHLRDDAERAFSANK
jgi:hypothetical protein